MKRYFSWLFIFQVTVLVINAEHINVINDVLTPQDIELMQTSQNSEFAYIPEDIRTIIFLAC